jgi:hypothetical protein
VWRREPNTDAGGISRRCAVASPREPEPETVEDAERRYLALRKALRPLISPATDDPDHPAVRWQVEIAVEIAASADRSRSPFPKRLALLEADLADTGFLERANRIALPMTRPTK